MKTPRLHVRCWPAAALVVLAVWCPALPADEPTIKIACIGDSITAFNTFESCLQEMLDANYPLSRLRPRRYVVRNFGVSATTALDLSASYMKTPKYADALAFQPDIVYIQLGTNDSRTGKTYDSIDRFAEDYTRLAKSFLALPSRPRVYLSDPPTMPNEGHWGDNDLNLLTGVIPRIHQVAAALNLPVIDQHTPTTGHPEWVRDNVHPSRETAGRVMAAAIYRAITGLEPPATLYPPVGYIPAGNVLADGGFEGGLGGWSAGGGGELSLGALARGGAKALRMARTSDKQGPAVDVKDALLKAGPGDWFFQAHVRLGSIAAGSPSARIALTVTDEKGRRQFATDAAGVATGVWTDLRAVRTVDWTGKLAAAELSVATGPGCADPLLVDDAVLVKYPYPAPSGRAVAPSYLTARPAAGGIALSWTDNANGWTSGGHTANETGLEIAWAADAGFTKAVGQAAAPADATGFTVADLKGGTTYYLRVRAANAAGKSAWTNPAAATTPGAPAGPAAPTDLVATAVADTTVALQWSDNADNETGCRVEWASDPDFVNNRGSSELPADAASYTVAGLEPSSTYAFRVRALGAAGDSVASNVVQKVTWRAVPNGTAVRLAATDTGPAQVDLTWADDCTNETGWVVEHAADPGFTEGRGTIAAKANATFCRVTGLKTGGAYWFRVRAVNALGSGDNIANPPEVQGPYSAVVSISKLTAPSPAATPPPPTAAGEAFDTPPAARLDGLEAGAGWSGPWKADDTYTLAAGSLAYADARGVTLATSGNRLMLVPAAAQYREASRPTGLFATRRAGGKALDVWFSCLLKPGGGSRDFNPWSATAYNEGPQAQGDTSLAYANHNAWKGGAETARKAPAVALKPGVANLILCRLQVPADLHSFTWTWYVNPADLTDPLKTSTVTVWTAENPAGTLRGLSGFAIRCRTDDKSTFEIDEIRYGDAPSDVAPRAGPPAGR